MKTIKLLPLVVIAFVLLSFVSSDIKLEIRSFIDGKVELKVPADFELMSEEMLKFKYPTEQRPDVVYTDKTAGINVAVRLTQNPASQEAIAPYADNFV
ncbi:MAG: hypothetical protein AAF985_15415, partial [Bacteroidota bacterium]